VNVDKHLGRVNDSCRMPADWETQAACWVAWPYRRDQWRELEGARSQIAAMLRALAEPVQGAVLAPERIKLLLADDECERSARGLLEGVAVEFLSARYDDAWLRDTGPLFVVNGDGGLGARGFTFNGWGGRFDLDHGCEVARGIAGLSGASFTSSARVVEGGALCSDGRGTLLVSATCLLSDTRNPGVRRESLERELRDALGADRVLWVEGSLVNDHTDGHVDTLARFVDRGTVVCALPAEDTDPNAGLLTMTAAWLTRQQDADGTPFELVHLPSPGLVADRDGSPLPASYLNFVVGNASVVVPAFGVDSDQAAVDTLADCFPGRRTIGLPADHLLVEGGAFHCVTLQQALVAATPSLDVGTSR
jgi:agmatine deiminase